MSEGAKIQDYILNKFSQSVKEFAETFDTDSRSGYVFLNKVVNREKLTPNDRKRLKSDFNIDVNQVLSNNTITGNTYADNQSTISIGQEPTTKYELLKLENKHLKEKIDLLTQEINSLKSTNTTLQQVIETLTRKT